MRHEADQNLELEKVETLRACFVRHPIKFINGGKRASVSAIRERTNPLSIASAG
jgi:hypothetical protein